VIQALLEHLATPRCTLTYSRPIFGAKNLMRAMEV
jgi:hypothetical protein